MQAKMAYLAGFVLSPDKNSLDEMIFNDQKIQDYKIFRGIILRKGFLAQEDPGRKNPICPYRLLFSTCSSSSYVSNPFFLPPIPFGRKQIPAHRRFITSAKRRDPK